MPAASQLSRVLNKNCLPENDWLTEFRSQLRLASKATLTTNATHVPN